jgi:hypothetical protein
VCDDRCPYVHTACGACGCSIRLDGGCGCKDNRTHPIGPMRADQLTEQQLVLTECCEMLGLGGHEYEKLPEALKGIIGKE